MNLHTFLSHNNLDEELNRYRVVCFSGTTYPLLFFSLFFSQLKRIRHASVVTADFSANTAEMQANMQTSFLGSSCLYWLPTFSNLDRKNKRAWLGYLSAYRGPNTIAFFLDGETPKPLPSSWLVVTVPEVVNKKLFNVLLQFLDIQRVERFTQELFDRHKTVPLDVACILAQYAVVSGKNVHSFFEQWLDDIVVPQSSLFELSQHFFAKRSCLFFAQWARIHDKFMLPFWITFWSEQLWRAHAFAQLSKQGNRVAAKKVGFRLPFSYLQRDWKKYRLAELQNAHQFIYTSDYRFKQGGTSFSLDLFYTKFFLDQFV